MNSKPYRKIHSKISQFLRHLYDGRSVVAAANESNVKLSTVYYWKYKYKKFGELFDRLLDAQALAVEDALYRTAIGELDGNVAAQKFYLLNRANKRWSDSVSPTADHTINVFINDKDDEKDVTPISAITCDAEEADTAAL